ncbi:sensor histidine kinase [Saccharothrix longispora]|uniref:histidine kinase n=1 Tax=Saccharothrix longispora TaxID=33920 RepID=A0ABU1PM69_9PSEU|nr:histidine kinase [Saccharothrix longispora]MDR6591754.1 signal transduction histidine kinase [Saccharothrix longispora]
MVTVLIEVLAVTVPAVMVLMAGNVPFTWSIPAALAACLLLPLRHRTPSAAAALCLPALVSGLGWPPAVVALYHLGRTTRPPLMITWVALATVVPSAFVIAREGLPPGAALLTVTFSLFMSGAPTALGALITTRRELTASLAEAHRARAAELEAREDGARAAERARIAREIHDAVGHHATLIAVEAAALAATTQDDDTRDTARRLRALAKESLTEMRAALGLLAPEPTPGLEGLQPLVDRARAAGLTVTCENHSPPPPAAVGRAAYRVVQEALTNVTKHAPGATAEIRITAHGDRMHLLVANSPPPTPAATTADHDGKGLHGLSERVGLLGGTLTTTARADGSFTLEATLPTGHPKVDGDGSTKGGSAPDHATA